MAPRRYTTTMGRLHRAASRLAVPEATRTTSAAISAVCAWPSISCTSRPGAWRSSARENISRVAALAIGAMNTKVGRCAASQRAVAAKSSRQSRHLAAPAARQQGDDLRVRVQSQSVGAPPPVDVAAESHRPADARRTPHACRARRRSAFRTAAGTAPDPPIRACCARGPGATPRPADSRTAPSECRRRAAGAPAANWYPAHRCRRRRPAARPGTSARMRASRRSRRGRSRSTSNRPMTASDSAGSQASQPAACIFGPATPKNSVSGAQPAQGVDQIRAQGIARRFSRHQTDSQRNWTMRYRTMLRSLRLMNSTKGRISAWVTAAFSSSSRAAFSFSPERYSTR